MASETLQLHAFIKEALQLGQSRDDIARVLAAAGWPGAQIVSAMDSFDEVPFPVPVPRPRTSLSARDAFLYLLLFLTLYMAAWSLGSLLFNFIDRALPDLPLRPIYVAAGGQRWSTAVIIVDAPVFFYLSWVLSREVARNPFKRLSPVRRWLTYLTLFLTASTLLGDLIYLVWDVLGGELVLRIALKSLVVAGIAGAIFGYYLIDLRRDERS